MHRDSTRGRGRSDRVHRVVDQIPHDGDKSLRIGARVVESGVFSDFEQGSPLCGDGDFGEEQGRQRGGCNARPKILGLACASGGYLTQVCHGLLVVAHADEHGQDVQPVGKFVLLCTQGVGQTIDSVQLTQQCLQLGAVPQRYYRTDVAPVDLNRHPVDDEQVLIG